MGNRSGTLSMIIMDQAKIFLFVACIVLVKMVDLGNAERIPFPPAVKENDEMVLDDDPRGPSGEKALAMRLGDCERKQTTCGERYDHIDCCFSGGWYKGCDSKLHNDRRWCWTGFGPEDWDYCGPNLSNGC